MSKKEVSDEMRKKYMELQMMQHQLQQLQQQISALDSQSAEMDMVQQALTEFEQVKQGTESFVTLTPGIFVKAKIERTDAVVLNVGSGAMVEKSIPDAKTVVAQQAVELRKLQEELTEQLQKIAAKAESTQEELRDLVK